MRVNDDGRTVAAMDVLAPGIGEIIGGSQREERLDVLDARMTAIGIDKEHYACTAICAVTARCRTRASAWASSARSPTSRAWPTCATRSRSQNARKREVLRKRCPTPFAASSEIASGNGLRQLHRQ